MDFKIIVLALFVSMLSIAEEKFGPVDCYLYAKYHTQLDETSMGELCAMAADHAPAKCYERAIQHGSAPSKTAITLCKRQTLEIIKR